MAIIVDGIGKFHSIICSSMIDYNKFRSLLERSEKELGSEGLRH